jgi:hypothetical protein
MMDANTGARRIAYLCAIKIGSNAFVWRDANAGRRRTSLIRLQHCLKMHSHIRIADGGHSQKS